MSARRRLHGEGSRHGAVLVSFVVATGIQRHRTHPGDGQSRDEPHDTLDANFLMGAAGVPEGEYELIPVGQDRAALVALEQGEIDAFVTAGAVSVAALEDFAEQEIRVIENESAESYYNTGNMVTLDALEDERDVAVRLLFTNDLIDDIWNFDVEAEIEAARNNDR